MHYLKLLTTQVSHTSEITTQDHGRALTAHLSISCDLYGSIQGRGLIFEISNQNQVAIHLIQ